MPPITLRIADVGMIRQWEGVVSGPDQLASSLEFADREWSAALQYLIVDYRKVTAIQLTYLEVRQLANQLRARPLRLRVAIIAPSDIVYGLARMWELTMGSEAHSWSVRVVRTVGAAIEWLESELPGVDFSETRALLE